MEEEAQRHVMGRVEELRREYELSVGEYQRKAKEELEAYIAEANTHAGDQVVRTYHAQREARVAESKVVELENELQVVKERLQRQNEILQQVRFDFPGGQQKMEFYRRKSGN